MVDARPSTQHHHPSHDAENADGPSTEGPSSLLADDAEELPSDADELELPADIELNVEGGEETESLDDLEAPGDEPEVEDTPGDDALIAAARIARFDEAHQGAEPVDFGPFDDDRRGTTDDADIGEEQDPTLVGKPRPRDDVDEQANVENTTGDYRHGG